MSLRVVTIGAFDLFHAGHRQLLTYGFELARGPVDVGVNSDEFIRSYKGEPMERTWTRVASVSASPRVGRVVIHTGDTLLTIRSLTGEEPSVLMIGSDWHDRDYLKQLGVTLDELRAIGVLGIFYAHRPADGPSSSKLRDELEREAFHAAADEYALERRARRVIGRDCE